MKCVRWAWLYPLAAIVACASSTPHGNQELGGDSGTSSHDGGGGSTGGGSSSGGSSGVDAEQQQGGGGQDGDTGEVGASSGSSSSSSGSDTGASSSGCTGLPLCDDFEQDTPGTKPAGWDVLMGCNPQTAQNPSGTADGPASGGGILVGVDTSQHHSGTNALRVVGGDSCGYYAVNTSAFAGGNLGPQYYARMWAAFSMAPTSGHNGWLSMNTTSTASHNPDLLRLGFQNNVIEWNWYGTDATLPDTDAQGAAESVATTPLTWVCLEFHIDSTTGNIEFWENGNAVTGLSWTGTSSAYTTSWANGGWKAGISPTSLGLGWGAFNGGMMTVWFDDVALGNSRIGCN